MRIDCSTKNAIIYKHNAKNGSPVVLPGWAITRSVTMVLRVTEAVSTCAEC